MRKRKRNTTLPDVIEDTILGSLHFTAALDGMDEYEGRTMLGRRPVTITLYTDEHASLRRCIDRARKIVQRLPFDLVRIHLYIEKIVFPDYNSIWRQDQKPLTIQKVLREVNLKMITTHPDPRATYWFEMSDLFGGHILQIEMGARFKILGFDTPG